MSERPGRTSIPSILSDHAKAIRELQRTRPGFVPPKDDSFIEIWSQGVPQGLVKTLDFVGAGVAVGATGDERGIINISGGGAGPFDGLVDCNAASSDPDNRIFLGIGEALDYLSGTLGLTNRINLFVRRRNPSSGATWAYTETAAVTVTADVFIMAEPNWEPLESSAGSILDIGWDHAGFVMSAGSWYINGLAINGKTTAGLSAKTSLLSGLVFLENCWIDPGNITKTAGRYLVASAGSARLNRCTMSNGWCAFGYATNCRFDIFTSGTYNPASGTSFFTMLDCQLCTSTSGGGAVTWNLPSKTTIRLLDPVTGCSGSTTATFNVNGAGLCLLSKPYFSPVINVTAIATASVEMYGHWQTVTLLAPSSSSPHQVRAQVDTLDVTGPALIDISTTGELPASGSSLIVRGNRVIGQMLGRASASASGQEISYIGATRSNIQASLDAGSASGTRKPYTFDAASTDNVLLVKRLSDFPAAGTDAGTNNRILPEGAADDGVLFFSGINH